jgi:multicomponent Na+:H+ antiporter subunit D
MSAHLPVLVVVVPLLAAALAPLAALVSARLVRGVTVGALAATAAAAGAALARALDEGAISYHLGGWPPPWGIEYVIDPLAGGMALLLSVFGLIGAVYAGPFLAEAPRLGAGGFHAVYLLLVTGLLGIVVTGDLFNLYVFLEISSLAVYALIALGGARGVVASLRYLLLGTVAGSFYLLGVGYLYALTGTLNMADMAVRLAPLGDSPGLTVGVAFIVVGLAIKMALFPLHGWLPDAYTFAPAPVTGLIAAVMTKVSAYALFRILFFVVAPATVAADALRLLGWAAALAAVAGSAMALTQTDVRRMLAYSSVGQMGYIVMGIAIGTPLALTGALLHILNHAVMKGCLFLVAGGVLFRTGVADVVGYSGTARQLPVSMAAFSIAAVSLVGLPPTAGFFSKWYLLVAAIDEGLWPFALALVASSLMTAVYLFRIVERSYFSERSEDAAQPRRIGPELPAGLLAPIVLLAVAVLLLGLLNQNIVTQIIAFALPGPGGR